MKNTLKFSILSIVFGLPISWYLFLQAFGQNQFQLSPVGMVDEICELASGTLYILDTSVIDDEKLHLQRLLKQFADNEWPIHYYSSSEACFGDFNKFPLIFVGDNREIMGNYKLSIEEVDRVIVEFDLFNHLRKRL